MQEFDSPQDDAQQQPVQPVQPSSGASPSQPVGVRIPMIRQPTMTYILVGSIAAIFVLQMIQEQTAVRESDLRLLLGGILDFNRILRGEYYRLFTAMFLHGGLAHVALNGYALWIFGQTVERFFGHSRFTLIYFLGGLAGNILEFAISRGFALGASGAVFAIFGAEMAFLYRNRPIFGANAERNLRSLWITLFINLAFGIYTQFDPSVGRIGLAAHAGGFLIGVLMGWFIGPRYELEADIASASGYRIRDMISINAIWTVSVVVALALAGAFFTIVTIYRSMRL
jgi:rhomboid protease GluP